MVCVAKIPPTRTSPATNSLRKDISGPDPESVSPRSGEAGDAAIGSKGKRARKMLSQVLYEPNPNLLLAHRNSSAHRLRPSRSPLLKMTIGTVAAINTHRFQDAWLGQVDVADNSGQQREQRSNPAAGFHDLEGAVREDKQIAFANRRHAESD